MTMRTDRKINILTLVGLFLVSLCDAHPLGEAVPVSRSRRASPPGPSVLPQKPQVNPPPGGFQKPQILPGIIQQRPQTVPPGPAILPPKRPARSAKGEESPLPIKQTRPFVRPSRPALAQTKPAPLPASALTKPAPPPASALTKPAARPPPPPPPA